MGWQLLPHAAAWRPALLVLALALALPGRSRACIYAGGVSDWSYAYRGLDWASTGHAECGRPDSLQSPIQLDDDTGGGMVTRSRGKAARSRPAPAPAHMPPRRCWPAAYGRVPPGAVTRFKYGTITSDGGNLLLVGCLASRP
jgi:hypothetical protein